MLVCTSYRTPAFYTIYVYKYLDMCIYVYIHSEYTYLAYICTDVFIMGLIIQLLFTVDLMVHGPMPYLLCQLNHTE